MFTSHIRPKARVRPMDAADLAVLPDQLDKAWLIDSHGLVCLVCTARVPSATGAVAHREDCHA